MTEAADIGGVLGSSSLDEVALVRLAVAENMRRARLARGLRHGPADLPRRGGRLHRPGRSRLGA